MTHNPQEQQSADVLDQSSSVEQRQKIIRDIFAAASVYPPEEAPVAGLYICIMRDGAFRIMAVNIEPEQVAPLLAVQADIAAKLADFEKRAQKRPERCTVLQLFPKRSAVIKSAAVALGTLMLDAGELSFAAMM